MTRKALVTFVMLVISCTTWSYEELTHGELSEKALGNSQLQINSQLLQDLGLKPLSTLDQRFPGSDGRYRTITELIGFGSRQEDIWPRSLNHFFDPYYNRPLTVGGLAVGNKSPDWILNEAGNIQNQQFSYRMAQFYFAQALSAGSENERNRYWGLLFQSLGHVIHHIQDMAQPDHTRNDQHLSQPVPLDRSLYERYTRLNPGKWAPLLPGNGSNIKFGTARSFWADSGGRGLADYTNHNFVSKDSNFRYRDNALASNEEYPAPVPSGVKTWPLDAPELGIPNASGLCTKLLSDPKVGAPPGTECEIDLIQSVVFDEYTGASAVNERASSFSAFNQYLTEVENQRGLFTLNFLNFDAGYRFLIPQAVNYSTGLINHFFRARLDLEGTTQIVNGNITIKVKNVSSAGNDFSGGSFSVFYDSLDQERKRIFVLSGNNVSLLPVGSIHEITAGPIPDDIGEHITLVFEGHAGQERTVAGVTASLIGLSGAGFIATDYSSGRPEKIRIFREVGVWKLDPHRDAEAGNIDWKGMYVNGVPTRVVSWNGPNSRYFRDRYSGMFGLTLYQEGRAFAIAPGPIYGAAINKDANGAEWLVITSNDGSGDVVYKRPNTLSLSENLYHPENATDGWRKIARIPNPPDTIAANRGWFFNGTGTEAQTMRETSTSHINKPLTRLKLIVSDASASVTDLGNELITEESPYSAEILNCASLPTANIVAASRASGGSVLAADYQDDKEILAYVSYHRESAHRTLLEATDLADRNYDQARVTESDSKEIKLRIGDNVFTLERSSEASTTESNAADESFSFDEHSEKMTVLALDLRGPLLIARQDLFTRRCSGGVSTAVTSCTLSNGPLNVSLTHRKMNNPVFNGSALTSSYTSSYARKFRYYEPGVAACNDRSFSNTHIFSQSLSDLPGNGSLSINSSIAAEDRHGNLFVSMNLHNDGSYFNFNFLTEGDPATLLGASYRSTFQPISPY